jgi:hypothetical protein
MSPRQLKPRLKFPESLYVVFEVKTGHLLFAIDPKHYDPDDVHQTDEVVAHYFLKKKG